MEDDDAPAGDGGGVDVHVHDDGGGGDAVDEVLLLGKCADDDGDAADLDA